MTYNIQIYSAKTMLAEIEAESEDFFDNDINLIPFTEKELQFLKSELEESQFEITKEDKKGVSFKNSQFEDIKAFLTNRGLYLRSDFDNAFEIGILTSEMAEKGNLAKYDPQAEGWEVLGE